MIELKIVFMCIFLFEMLIDRRCRLFSNKNGKDKFFLASGQLTDAMCSKTGKHNYYWRYKCVCDT